MVKGALIRADRESVNSSPDQPTGAPPTSPRDWRLLIFLAIVALAAPFLVAKYVAPAYDRHAFGEPIPVDDKWHHPQEFVTKSVVLLVPVVRFDDVDIGELAADLAKRYDIRIEVRPAIQLESTAVDTVRNELIADPVLRALRRSHTVSTPIGGGHWPIVIGLTDFEMYATADTKTQYSSTAQDREHGYAIVSAEPLEPGLVERYVWRETLVERVRDVVAWNIAVLYLDLRPDTDPDDVPRQAAR